METDLCAVAPRDWEIRSIADVCKRVTSGGTPSRREPAFYEGGTWPWVKTQELQDGWIDDTEEHITDRAIDESSAKVLPANTILLAMYGATVGQLGILRRPMTCNQACCALIADPKKADFRFLYYQLLLIRSELKSLATGAAQQNLSGTVIKSLCLPFPKIQEQRAIAHILGTLDDKIELNRKQNETLEAMARALFKAWFVDFEPVRAKMEGRWQRGQSLPGLPAHLYDLFPDRLVESELGEIPEGWEVSELGGFVETIKGRSYKSEELTESTTALVTLKSFARGGGYRTDGLKPFTGKHKPEQIIEPGEVVVACTDVTQAAELVGRAAIVRKSRKYQTLVASLDTMIVRPRSDRITRSFLYHLGRSDAFVAHTYSHTTGTTVLHLGKDAIPTYRFALPPRDLVHQFDVIASNALSRIDTLEEESERLTTLRDVLLPKLISGELRIADAEAFLKGRG